MTTKELLAKIEASSLEEVFAKWEGEPTDDPDLRAEFDRLAALHASLQEQIGAFLDRLETAANG